MYSPYLGCEPVLHTREIVKQKPCWQNATESHSPGDMLVGCADILGVSELKTKARVTHAGVGTAPFQWSGEGEGIVCDYPADGGAT